MSISFLIKLLYTAAVLIAVLTVMVACSSETPESVDSAVATTSPIPQPETTAEQSGTSTEVRSPTATPRSTPAIGSTATPRPTPTPVPTPTPASQVATSGVCSPVDLSEVLIFLRPYAKGVACIETDERHGSGFVIENTDLGEGILLTNAHVVGIYPEYITVYLENVMYSAEIVKISEERDLAMLRICCGDFTVLERANRGAQLHDAVGVLGFPNGELYDSTGWIRSAVQFPGDPNTYLEHSADVDPGSSGGPLLASPLTRIERVQQGRNQDYLDKGDSLVVMGVVTAELREFLATTYAISHHDVSKFVDGDW